MDQSLLSSDEMTRYNLDPGQVKVLKKCFDGFSDSAGVISTDTVGSILSMMAWKLPNRKDSSQICPVTLSEISESCNAERDTGLIGDLKFGYEGLNEIIKEIDIDGSGLLEFTEFCHLASWFLKEEDETMLLKELKEAFRIYDKDEEGFISTNSLKEILKELDSQLSEEELEGIIEEVDTDGSGTLDFDEFVEMMTG